MSERPASLVRYQQVTSEAAELHQEKGDMVGDIHRAKVDAYHQSLLNGDNVTTARHHADAAVVNWTVEMHRIDGELDALLVELKYLDQLLAWENHA